jgi:hypothetical protein
MVYGVQCVKFELTLSGIRRDSHQLLLYFQNKRSLVIESYFKNSIK